jgi:uncharacterized delta-60 repeat protein
MPIRPMRLMLESLELRTVPTAGLGYTFGQAGRTLIPVPDNPGAVLEVTTDVQQRVLVLESFSDGLAILRFTPDGLPDTSFGDHGIARLRFNGVTPPPGDNTPPTTITQFKPADFVVDGQGRIVIGGTDIIPQPSNAPPRTYFAAIRLTPDGKYDASFDGDGIVVVPVAGNATAVAVAPDGKIVLAGDLEVVRLIDTGAPDPSFDGDGVKTLPFTNDVPEEAPFSAADVGVDGMGRIVVIGGQKGKFEAVRLTTDGQLDSMYGLDGTVTVPLDLGEKDPEVSTFAYAEKLVLATDGTATIGGPIDAYLIGIPDSGVSGDAVVRLTPNGTLDSTFDEDGIWIEPPYDFAFKELEVDPSGRVIVSNTVF